MAHRSLLLRRHFRKGQGRALNLKNRVVTKTGIPPRLAGDHTSAAALNFQQHLPRWIRQAERSAKLSAPIVPVAELAQEPRNPFWIGCGIAGGMHPWSSPESHHAEAGIIR